MDNREELTRELDELITKVIQIFLREKNDPVLKVNLETYYESGSIKIRVSKEKVKKHA